jgi:uncharacterized protein YcfL
MSKKLSPLLLLLLLCVGCTHTEVNSKQSQALTSKPNLTTVLQAQTVEIQNDWNGYSDITPILRHSKLRLEQQKLVGNAYIAVGGYGAGGIHQQQTTKVKISAAVTTKFLATLSKTPLETGTYKPQIDRTDDYPSVKIQIKIDKQEITLRSESQGVDRIPWKVTVKENNTTKEYITNSPFPAQALRILSPTLDRPGIEQIIQRRRNRKNLSKSRV